MVFSLHSDHYQIDDFLYSPTEGVVIRGEKRVILKSRENELLHILIRHHPMPASRGDIQTALWSNSYATSSTLSQAVKTLRDDLCDQDKTLIRTIPKTGYILGASPSLIRFQSSPQKITSSVRHRQLMIWLLSFCAIFSCILLGYQLGTPALPSPSAIHGNVHYLFEPTPIEQARFALLDSGKNGVFIGRKTKGYLVCQQPEGVMTCALVP